MYSPYIIEKTVFSDVYTQKSVFRVAEYTETKLTLKYIKVCFANKIYKLHTLVKRFEESFPSDVFKYRTKKKTIEIS